MKDRQEKLDEKLRKIEELLRERDRINAELAKMMGMEEQKAPESLPPGIVLMDEIKRIFQEKGQSMRILEVKRELDHKHRVNLPRRNVQATMAYMVKKGILNKEAGYGMFSLKIREDTS